MIGEACLFARGGWVIIKDHYVRAWDIFPDSSRKKGRMAKRER